MNFRGFIFKWCLSLRVACQNSVTPTPPEIGDKPETWEPPIIHIMHCIVKTARVAGGCIGELVTMAANLGRAEGTVHLYNLLRKFIVGDRWI